MKRIICLLSVIGLLAFITTGCFASSDKLGLAGTYKCTGFDSHDGYYTGTLKLTLDFKASDFSHNFGAYHFALTEGSGGDVDSYTGEVAAHGDLVAVYFQNTDENDPTDLSDRGVGIGTVSHDQDSKGNFITILHKFYYEPAYERDKKGTTGMVGGQGTETCTKVN